MSIHVAIHIHMFGLQVCNKGLPYIQGLTQLRKLALQGTGVTSAGMPVIGALTALQDLDLAWTSVDSQGRPPGPSAAHHTLQSCCLCTSTAAPGSTLQIVSALTAENSQGRRL